MNLLDIMLSKINQAQEDKYGKFHFYEVSKVVKQTETENRVVGARDLGQRKWGTSRLKVGTNTGDHGSNGAVLYFDCGGTHINKW